MTWEPHYKDAYGPIQDTLESLLREPYSPTQSSETVNIQISS